MSQDLSSLFDESVGDDGDDIFSKIGKQNHNPQADFPHIPGLSPSSINSKESRGPFDHPEHQNLVESITLQSNAAVVDSNSSNSGSSRGPFDHPEHQNLVESIKPQSSAAVESNSFNLGRPSLIAARRMMQKREETLIQPEQDVIYKQYNPHASSSPPPPPPSFHVANQAAQSPASVSLSPPIKHVSVSTSSHNVTYASIQHSIPSYFPVRSPVLDSPIKRSSPFSQNMIFPNEDQLANISLVSHNVTSGQQRSGGKEELRGLRVFCSLGFGGRLVVGGGRFGPRLAMPTLNSVLSGAESTSKMMKDILALPGPLGNITLLTTEQVISFCRSSPDLSLRDSNHLWSFLQMLLLQTKNTERMGIFNQVSPRQQFLVSLWRECVEENGFEGTNTNSILFRFVDQIVSGNISECIGMAKQINPNLYPLAMAVASIHSAEYFRESVLAYTLSGERSSSQVAAAPLVESESDSILLECLKISITAFASTANIETVLSGSLFSLWIGKYWKLFAALIGSLIKPVSSGAVAFLVRLGELLCSSKRVCAGHLCILLSGKSVSGVLDSVDSHDALICLLGADHRDIAHFNRLLDVGPLQLSEVYEYVVRSISPSTPFFVSLQPWKFAYASFLCDLGHFDLAEKYLQVINAFSRAVPTNKYTPYFRSGVRELELRISVSKQSLSSSATYSSGIAEIGQNPIGAIWGGIRAVAAQTSSRIL